MSRRSTKKNRSKDDSADERAKASWKEYKSYLKKASKEEVEELAFDLFKELQVSDEYKACSVMKSFGHKMDDNKNLALQGDWILKYARGAYQRDAEYSDGEEYSDDYDSGYPVLHIHPDDLSSASLMDTHSDWEGMELKSPADASTLVYELDLDLWEDENGMCRDHDFKATLTVQYDHERDVMKGHISSVPTVKVKSGKPSCAYGGEFDFTGRRKRYRKYSDYD